MDEGRVDLPEDNSAWFFYRWVADRYPEIEEAQNGLIAVQQDMLVRAIQHAVEMDFDAAELLLEIAASVIDEQNQQEQARTVIASLKTSRVKMLESRAMQLMYSGDFNAAERVLIDLIALGGQEETVTKLRVDLEDARNYGGFKAGQIIQDTFVNAEFRTPESVVIPTGSYLIGSSGREKGRADNEGPQQRVTFQRGFAMGRHEVSVAEFGVFIEASGYRTEAERSGRSTVYDANSGRLTEKEDVDWQMGYEGSPAGPEDPVIHVSWNDAQAYMNWLANGTGKPYRLPSEAEFEYALRAGSNTQYWWGNASPSSVVENLTGERDSSHSRRFWAEAFTGYGDKFWGPAPAASFEPNPFGLYDMGGNVSEWVRDCWHDTYVRAPVDGSAWINPGCPQRVIRGGHWASLPIQTRSAYRRHAAPDYHDARVGFRIARDL
jgi:formylglycine-generating enzyme required for sulfatase activity